MRRSDHLPLVALGGTIGAAVRWAVGEVVLTPGFPWATLVVNVVGCALLALVLSFAPPPTPRHRLLAVGFCGGLTTLSTFSLDIIQLLDAGQADRALVYLGASLVLGLGSYLAVRRLTSPFHDVAGDQ